MDSWYECPICKKKYPPEAQRAGNVCKHTPEEWAQDVRNFLSCEPEEAKTKIEH